MLFNSFSFLQFFAVVLVLHYLPFPWAVKKFNLLVASYLFYAAWNPPFVVLIWLSTLVDWYVVKGLARTERRALRRLLLLTSLTCNLGLLGFFKYGGFVLENFTAAVNAIGIPYAPAAPNIILPVGISFYTFQTLSYTIDVYRGQARGWHSFLDYALYVTFFPQLVAGPIVRATDFLPQCIQPRVANLQQLGWGLCLLVLGLFQKIVLADAFFAPIADKVFANAQHLPTLDAWIGTLAFAGQIFCDFAGYSTCAIGAALCLGFHIQDNFRFPYAAVGFSDFWRRWHISLSSWLRDYLYIPLGGNRYGPSRTYAALFTTMLLGGLWHGAAWTFVIWGALHGSYLIVERLLTQRVPAWRVWRMWPTRLVLALFTFAMVCFAWVPFRAQSFADAYAMAGSLFGRLPETHWSEVRTNEAGLVLALMAGMLVLQGALRDSSVEAAVQRIPWWLRGIGLGGMIVAMALTAGDDRAFIYFQF